MDLSGRCERCKLITSEFLLSKDFSGGDQPDNNDNNPNDNPKPWTYYQGKQGKRYRVLVHHSLKKLRKFAVRARKQDRCQICVLFHKIRSPFGLITDKNPEDPKFPDIHGPFRVVVSETGGLEYVPPGPEWGIGDLRLGWWEEIGEQRGENCSTGPQYAGQMRPRADLSHDKRDKELCQLAQEVIRPWLRLCDAGHPCGCGGLQHPEHGAQLHQAKLDEPPLLPTRVIDVGSGSPTDVTPRLHISQTGERAHYLTLSYRWGEGNVAAMTTAHNLAERTTGTGLDLAALPNTIRDAINVTRSIGVTPYIWIDAVCIVQVSEDGGDRGDFATEGLKMADYYGNSYCTIAASAADDTSEGFSNPRSRIGGGDGADGVSDLKECCELGPWVVNVSDDETGGSRTEIRTAKISRCLPRWAEDVRGASMNQRGWVFQERALSRRILHWGKGALWWECDHDVRASEYYPWDPLTASHNQEQPYMTLEKWLDSLAGSAGNEEVELELRAEGDGARLWPDWSGLVGFYTPLELGRESDRLIALQGLVGVVCRWFPGQEYLFGLWRPSLVESLCWEVAGRRAGSVSAVQQPCSAPSWSWASCPHPVRYLYPSTHAHAEILGHQIHPGDRCVLHIKGSMERAPFKRDEIVKMKEHSGKWAAGDYEYYLSFDSCPDRLPDMSAINLLLMGVRKFDARPGEDSQHAMQFLMLTKTAPGGGNLYTRVGHALCWTRSFKWRNRKAQEVEVFLV